MQKTSIQTGKTSLRKYLLFAKEKVANYLFSNERMKAIL